MTAHSFFVPGKPSGWRQQHAAINGHAVSRLAKPAKNWQQAAISLIRDEWGAREPIPKAVPVSLLVEVRFARPNRLECSHKPTPCAERTPDKRRCSPEVLAGGPLPHLGTPDLTNLLKNAEDAVVRAGVLADDCNVWQSAQSKVYAARGERPGVTIRVRWAS